MKIFLLLIFLISFMFVNANAEETDFIQEGYMHFPVGEKFFQYKTEPKLLLAEEIQNRCWFASTFVNHNDTANVYYKFPKDMVWPGSYENSTFMLITTNTTSFLDKKEFRKITPSLSEDNLVLNFKIKQGLSQLIINSTKYFDEDGNHTNSCKPIFDEPPRDYEYYDKIFPLKLQISYAEAFGFSKDSILCKNGQELVQKYNGDLACVTKNTKEKLFQRGWMKPQGSMI